VNPDKLSTLMATCLQQQEISLKGDCFRFDTFKFAETGERRKYLPYASRSWCQSQYRLISSLLYPDKQPHATIQFSSGLPYISTNENCYEVDIATYMLVLYFRTQVVICIRKKTKVDQPGAVHGSPSDTWYITACWTFILIRQNSSI